MVLAPHPDDEAIGCGGSLCLHRRGGDPVHVVFLTSGERGLADMTPEAVWAIREAEAREAAKVLDIGRVDFLRLPDLGLADNIALAAERLQTVLQAQPADLIYLPHPGESHPDHEAVLPIISAALAAAAPQHAPELRGYEVWSPLVQHGWVEDISEVMPQKLRAIRCYKSQLDMIRYDRAVRGLNRFRGIINAASRYAEAFQYYEAHPIA
jgi:LmbE family N-acetylglucosaminyl deacetylase